jgi:hypothetical protein
MIMNAAIYKVDMTFLAAKDDYNDGETGEYGSSWEESKEFNALAEVKQFVKDQTYSGYEYIEYDNYLKRYTTAYMTTDENTGEMYESEKEAWERGEINGWNIMVDFTVKKFTPKLIGNIKFN